MLTIKSSQTKIDEFVNDHIIELDASYRGGNIKIDVSSLFPEIVDEDPIIGAYQNYLGGGLAGCIVGASMFNFNDLTPSHQVIAERIKETAKKLLFKETNGEDEVLPLDYIKNQSMPVSAY